MMNLHRRPTTRRRDLERAVADLNRTAEAMRENADRLIQASRVIEDRQRAVLEAMRAANK